MAIDFDFKDPKNQKKIMIFMIPVVILAAFFQFMVKPVKLEVAAKQGELATIRQKVNSVRKTLKTPDQLRTEKEALTIKLSELELLLPNEENVATLLTQFSMVERDANVYLVGFDAAETEEGGAKPYKSNKYKMTIEAGYHQYADFISRLLALQRIMSISELKIKMNPLVTERTETYEGMENQPRNLTVECMLTTYLYQKMNVSDEK